MTEQDLKIQEQANEIKRLKETLRKALKDIDYILCQYEMCAICAYADGDCDPEGSSCVPKWRGLT